jgi:hypothetical protein
MWTKEVTLPVAGLTIPVYNESATASPMGRGGVRVKWRRHDVQREVRLGAEVAYDGEHLREKLEALAAEFGGEIVATTGLDDADEVEYSTHVIRERDLRRHVIVVVHHLDDHRVLQGSIECTGADPSEIRDEWAALEQLMTTTEVGEIGEADDPVVITMVNRSIGLAFDFPGGIYAADVAYGMDQLHISRNRCVGRVVYGGLAAHGSKNCVTAMKQLAGDPGLRGASKVMTDDDGLVWLRAHIADSSGHEGELVVVARAVRGIALAMGALVLDDEDPDEVIGVMAAAATSARRLRKRGAGRPSRELADVLSKMDTFRKRVDAASHRVSGG